MVSYELMPPLPDSREAVIVPVGLNELAQFMCNLSLKIRYVNCLLTDVSIVLAHVGRHFINLPAEICVLLIERRIFQRKVVTKQPLQKGECGSLCH